MERTRINSIIKRYLDGECTEEERDILYLWLTKQADQGEWQWGAGEQTEIESELRFRLKDLLDTPVVEKPQAMPSGISLIRLITAAASILILVGLGIWHFYYDPSPDVAVANNVYESRLLEPYPALAIHVDGINYQIDSLAVGEELTIGSVIVKKIKENSLVYQRGVEDIAPPTMSPKHTLYVPKGRDFNVTLPDGTAVWLNTESVLEFPADFAHGERRVAMSGEAFFEVVSDKRNPFIVMTHDAEVVATGTQFNVKAYYDEQTMYTTLVEGVVTVASGGAQLQMAPNEQAIVQLGLSGVMLEEANVANIIAKKSGYFAFYKQDITSIMKEIARWYDVEVYFQGEVSQRLFGGTFSRSKELGDLLEYFESIGGFKFKQKGRRIIVMS